MRKQSQQTRLLALLRRRGSNGIRSYERAKLRMLQMPVRILELRRQGFDIISKRCDNGKEVRYVLVEK